MITFILISWILVSLGIFILSFHLQPKRALNILGRIISVFFIIHASIAFLSFEVLNAKYLYVDAVRPFGFAYGPLFYFSLKVFEEDEDNFLQKIILHGIPFYLATVFYLFYMSFDSLRIYFQDVFPQLWYIILCVFWTAYVVLALYFIVKKEIHRSSFEISIYSFILFVVVVNFITFTVVRYSEDIDLLSSRNGALTVFVFMLIHAIVWYKHLFVKIKENGRVQEDSFFSSKILDFINFSPQEEKIRKDGFVPNLKEIDMQEEDSLLILNKIDYLNSQLNLSSQAHVLKISSARLSEIIKKETGMNYPNYINKKRIEHAVSLLKENKHHDLNELMLASGFLSKSSFYRNFRRFTSYTPSEFIRRVLK